MKKYHVIILFSVFTLLFFIWYAINGNKDEIIVIEADALSKTATAYADTSTDVPDDTPTPNMISVYITGEIKNPGVYELIKGSRIEDAVLAAGGFTDKADQENVNLSKLLTDEMHIKVHGIEDIAIKDVVEKNDASHEESDPVNINIATKQELMSLPGIGDVIATAIIEYREINGDFLDISDIKNVSRVGDKLFLGIESKICVE